MLAAPSGTSRCNSNNTCSLMNVPARPGSCSCNQAAPLASGTPDHRRIWRQASLGCSHDLRQPPLRSASERSTPWHAAEYSPAACVSEPAAVRFGTDQADSPHAGLTAGRRHRTRCRTARTMRPLPVEGDAEQASSMPQWLHSAPRRVRVGVRLRLSFAAESGSAYQCLY